MGNILIIDDDETYANLVKQRLERVGHHVSVHIGPFGATAAASRAGIQLILLDVFMPGLAGPDLLEVMRQNPNLARTKFILCSSMDAGPLRELAERHRVDGYLTKSGDRDELLSMVKRTLPILT